MREKLIAGQSDTSPTPEHRNLPVMYPGVIVDHAGTFEYQKDNMIVNITGKQWTVQGSMGYGNSPIGNGTRPYRSFMSNMIDNTTSVGTYTGSTQQPYITFGPLSHTGAGVTFSAGVAEHHVMVSSEEKQGFPAGADHKLISVYGINTNSTHVAGATADHDDLQNGVIHFCYRNASDNGKGYSLYVETQDENGVTTEQLLTPSIHFATSYGRLMPVSLNIEPNGDFNFRVDATAIESSLSMLTGGDDTQTCTMPASGDLHLTIRGLSPTPFASPWPGVNAPICRITNVAVNDNDDSDSLGHIGLPPFVTGIPCTPVRESVDNWELPISVLDPNSTWVPYSESSPTVEYGLNAIADSQMFETRGVAASGTGSPLYVMTADKSTLTADLNDLGLTGLSAVEAVNASLYDAAVLGPYDLTIQLKQSGNFDDITSVASMPGVGNDFVNTTTTFFQDITNQNMTLDTFASGMVFTLSVSGG